MVAQSPSFSLSHDKHRDLFVEVRLHPNAVAQMIERAPNDDAKAAWQSGSAVSGVLNCVKLTESNALAYYNVEGCSWYDPREDIGAYLRESVEWWERRVGGKGTVEEREPERRPAIHEGHRRIRQEI